MTGHDVPFLWCLWQVALLATLGVCAAWLFARRSPAAGASATAAAAAMIVVVTLLIPARLPKLELWQPSHSGDLVVDATAPVALNENRAANSSADAGGLPLDVEDLALRVLASVGASGMATQKFGSLMETFAVRLFACGAAVGIVRFLWSLSFITWLRKHRTPVVDNDLLQLFAELKRRLGVGEAVELCESARVSSPAVIGWRRPVVLMPEVRDDWSAEQLRAALAHELAHVKRGDYAWRCVAGMTQAIHFSHPLVHVLVRRLTLMQELATDAVAATAAGGRETYLRALSELVIRLDDTSRLRAEPIVLPALSSNLVRRIAMLRSREGSKATRKYSLATTVAVALIALVGVGTMALRGSADGIGPTSGSAADSGRLFKRTPLSTSLLAVNKGGLFVIRPSEMAKQPQFRPVFQQLNKFALEALRQFEGVNVNSEPAIRLEAIEYIAGVPKLQLRPKTGHEDGQQGVFMVGCAELVVRFHDEIAWEEWIEDAIPDAKHVTEDGFTHFVLPDTPAAGAWLGVAVRDGRTLVFATDAERLQELATADVAVTPFDVDAWNSLDGGLATFVARGELPDSVLPEEPGPKMAVTIMLKTMEYGAAFDVDPATSRSNVRFMLTSRDQAAAEAVQAAVNGLLPLLIGQLELEVVSPSAIDESAEPSKRVQTAGDANTERNVRDYWLEVMRSMKTRLELQSDGSVQVRIEGGAVMPTTIMTAYEYEIADGGSGSEGETERQ